MLNSHVSKNFVLYPSIAERAVFTLSYAQMFDTWMTEEQWLSILKFYA